MMLSVSIGIYGTEISLQNEGNQHKIQQHCFDIPDLFIRLARFLEIALDYH